MEYAEYFVHSCSFLSILVYSCLFFFFLRTFFILIKNKQEQTRTDKNKQDIERTPYVVLHISRIINSHVLVKSFSHFFLFLTEQSNLFKLDSIWALNMAKTGFLYPKNGGGEA